MEYLTYESDKPRLIMMSDCHGITEYATNTAKKIYKQTSVCALLPYLAKYRQTQASGGF